MKMSKAMHRFLEAAKKTNAYWFEKAKLDFSIKLEERRRARNMSYKDLAEAAEVSQPYITKVFRGDANFTIESMVKFAHATGGRLEISIVDACEAASPIAEMKVADSPFSRPVTKPARHNLSVLAPSSTTASNASASNGDRDSWRDPFKLAA